MSFAGAEPNPFDPTTTNPSPEQAQLEEIVQKSVKYGALNLRVALPCRIEAVLADQTVNLQPLLQTLFRGGKPLDMPPLHEVPVVMPQGADYRIGYPLAAGDTGLAIFCDRNIDAFLASDATQTQDPQDDRAHDLSDAVFYPGLVPTSRQTTDVQHSGDLVLQNGALTMRLQKSGRLSLANASQEFVALLDQLVAANIALMQDLASAMVLTPLGPAPFLSATLSQFASVQTTLQALKAHLETFKTGS